jgi:hypothetical protein
MERFHFPGGTLFVSADNDTAEDVIARSRAALLHCPRWSLAGAVVWTGDIVHITPQQDELHGVEAGEILPRSGYPSSALSIAVGDPADANYGGADGTVRFFHQSPHAAALRNADPMFATVDRDVLGGIEATIIAGLRVVFQLPRRLSVVPDDLPPRTIIRVTFPPNVRKFATPPRRQESTASDAGTAKRAVPTVSPRFGGEDAAVWPITVQQLRDLRNTTRVALADSVPKAVAAVLLPVLADAHRLPFVAAVACAIPIGDYGSSTSIERARHWHEATVLRCRRVVGEESATGNVAAACDDLPPNTVAWLAALACTAEAHIRYLESPAALRESQRWADIVAQLRRSFADEANQAMLGAVAGSRQRGTLIDPALKMTLSQFAESLAVSCKAASLVSSPLGLRSEAEMVGVTAQLPMNVSGPRLPLPIILVFVKQIDFETSTDVGLAGAWNTGESAVSSNGGSVLGSLRSATFEPPISVPRDGAPFGGWANTIAPHAATMLYRRFFTSFTLALESAVLQGATAIVVPPLMTVEHSSLFFALEADDLSQLVRTMCDALFDAIEAMRFGGEMPTEELFRTHVPARAPPTVFVCGERYHGWVAQAVEAKSRRCIAPIVLHDRDAKSLVLNLAEDGESAALVVPADTWTLTLSRPGAELRRFENTPAVHAALLAHWPTLADVMATTTAAVTVGHAFVPANLQDASDRPYGPACWAPVEMPTSCLDFGSMNPS